MPAANKKVNMEELDIPKIQEALYACIDHNDVKSVKNLFNAMGSEVTKELLGLTVEESSHLYTNILPKMGPDNRPLRSSSSTSSSSANSSPNSSSRSIVEQAEIEISAMDPLMFALDRAIAHKTKAMPFVKLFLENGASAGSLIQKTGLRPTSLAHYVPDRLDVYKALLNNIQEGKPVSELCFNYDKGTVTLNTNGKLNPYMTFFEHAIVKCNNKSEVTKVIKTMQEVGVNFDYRSSDPKDETPIAQLNGAFKVPGINKSLVLEAMVQVIKITGEKPKPNELTNLNHTEKLKIEKAASQASSRCI